MDITIPSHPSWVCGLKQRETAIICTNTNVSHPSWVCGLKQVKISSPIGQYKSHPSWVCGLKQNVDTNEVLKGWVTPFVGVWIETL